MKGWLIIRNYLCVLLLSSSCAYHELPEIVDCSKSAINIDVIFRKGVTNCLANDGSFEVSALGGTGIYYEYSIDQKEFQQTGLFTDLISGNHFVTARDENGCMGNASIFLSNFESDLGAAVNTVPDSECFTDNGQAIADIYGGLPPYMLYLNDNGSTEKSFTNLAAGLYNLQIADAASCTLSIAFQISRVQTSISFKSDIKPIIDTRCAKSGCHLEGSGRVDLSIFNNIRDYSAKIKLYTQNLRMPQDGVLSKEEIQKIACWVDDGALNN